jgi:chromosome segregation ATPase
MGASRMHARRHEGMLQVQRRQHAAADDWRRAHAAFLSRAEQQLREASAAATAGADAAASRLSSAVSRQLLHDQLAGMSMLRGQQQQAQAAARAAAEAVQAAQAAAAGEAARQRAAQQRAQVQDYKQQLQQERCEAQRLDEQAAQAAAAAAGAAMAAARTAVEARQGEALHRLQQQQEQARAAQAATDARRQRLAAIAAALGPQLARDPARLLQATAASSAAPRAQHPAFRPVHGFTTQQVVADPRFRLVEALRGAGLLAGAAGRAGYTRAAMALLAQPVQQPAGGRE